MAERIEVLEYGTIKPTTVPNPLNASCNYVPSSRLKLSEIIKLSTYILDGQWKFTQHASATLPL